MGCASGSLKYDPPIKIEKPINNKKVVNLDCDKAWSKLVEKLSETSYSTDHLDKDSGFINLNFSVDNLEKYVDCGRFLGHFKNIKIDQKIDFNRASKYAEYYQEENGNVFSSAERI